MRVFGVAGVVEDRVLETPEAEFETANEVVNALDEREERESPKGTLDHLTLSYVAQPKSLFRLTRFNS